MVPNVAFGTLPVRVAELRSHGLVGGYAVGFESRNALDFNPCVLRVSTVIELWRESAYRNMLIFKSHLLSHQTCLSIFWRIVEPKNAVTPCARNPTPAFVGGQLGLGHDGLFLP